MKPRIALMLVMALASAAALAAGAPWFKWMNRYDRTIICSQLSPGEAWVQYQGPFMDLRCSKPGNPQ